MSDSPDVVHLVVPTGVVFNGVCDLKGEHCEAREGGVVTAVTLVEKRRQVNVCSPCLDEWLEAGRWRIEGRSFANTPLIFDLAVLSPTEQLTAAIEVKTSAERGPAWRAEVFDQLRRYAMAVPTVHLLAMVTPHRLWLWDVATEDPMDCASASISSDLDEYSDEINTESPAFEVKDPAEYVERPVEASKKHLHLERAAMHYFRDVGSGKRAIQWPSATSDDFLEALRSGKVIMEYRVSPQQTRL